MVLKDPALLEEWLGPFACKPFALALCTWTYPFKRHLFLSSILLHSCYWCCSVWSWTCVRLCDSSIWLWFPLLWCLNLLQLWSLLHPFVLVFANTRLPGFTGNSTTWDQSSPWQGSPCLLAPVYATFLNPMEIGREGGQNKDYVWCWLSTAGWWKVVSLPGLGWVDLAPVTHPPDGWSSSFTVKDRLL